MMLRHALLETIVGRAGPALAAVVLVLTLDTHVSAQSASWTVETTPQLQIGRESGPPEYLFSRVVGVQRLADGRVVAGEGTDPSIRFYSAQGIFIKKTGARGQGPGEFSYLSRLLVTPTELWGVPGAGEPTQVFDLSGTYLRTINATWPAAVFSDGSYFATRNVPLQFREDAPVKRIHTDTMLSRRRCYVALTRETEKLDPLEFLGRLVTHIPNKRQVMTRYYGWYANRVRGTRKKLASDSAAAERLRSSRSRMSSIRSCSTCEAGTRAHRPVTWPERAAPLLHRCSLSRNPNSSSTSHPQLLDGDFGCERWCRRRGLWLCRANVRP